MREVTKGATSQSIDVFIQDSSVTTGAGLPGLVYNSASLVGSYRRGPVGSRVAITLATLANAQAAFSSGGFVEIDATNMPGWYRLDVPDAALAAGSGDYVDIHLKGAANMVPCPVQIQLKSFDGVGLATVPANLTQINGQSGPVNKLDRGLRGTTLFTVGSASTASAVVVSSLDPSSQANDQWNGKVMTFADNTTTTQLRGQSARITDYVHGTLTFTLEDPLTVAPSSGDVGTIS
jgi:hypothetical protein